MPKSIGTITVDLKPNQALLELLSTIGEISTDLQSALSILRELETGHILLQKENQLLQMLLEKYRITQ